MGNSFSDTNLSPEDWLFTERILSSDALAAQIITRIKRNIPTSVVRMSDGERAIMRFGDTGNKACFLKNEAWLKRYGLDGADLTVVANDLRKAAEEADYLALTISGVFYKPDFDMLDVVKSDRRLVDQFYPQLWEATKRTGPILRAAPCLLLHRDCNSLCSKLSTKYRCAMYGIQLNSWKDHEKIIETVKQRPETTVLVSGGASGKRLCVKLSQETKKIVLDVGEAIGACWSVGVE